jgi:hypothetical protein
VKIVHLLFALFKLRQKKDYEQAVELFGLQRQLYPDSPYEATALYRIAVCYHIY